MHTSAGGSPHRDLHKILCIFRVICATSRTTTYRRRQPERTVQSHLASWLELAQVESGRLASAHVEREFHRYLECGILADELRSCPLRWLRARFSGRLFLCPPRGFPSGTRARHLPILQ
jgi:hypothetical protein